MDYADLLYKQVTLEHHFYQLVAQAREIIDKYVPENEKEAARVDFASFLTEVHEKRVENFLMKVRQKP